MKITEGGGKQMDQRMHRWKAGKMDGWMDGWTDGRTMMLTNYKVCCSCQPLQCLAHHQ